MKKIIAFLIVLFFGISIIFPVKGANAETASPSSISIKNKVTETLKYFDPKPTFTSAGTDVELDGQYIYKMGEIIQGEIDEDPGSTWIVALEDLSGSVVDQVSMSGGKSFSISTGNVSKDGKYKIVATDSLSNPNWLISTYVYIKYNLKIDKEDINQCPDKTSTISGWITRGNGQTVLVPVTVTVAYPDKKVAASYVIPANSSGQFVLSFSGTTDLWDYYIYISDGYPGVSPDNDAIIYKTIPNYSNITWTLKSIIANPLLYDDEEGNLNQSIVLELIDQDGKPVTGKKDYFYVGMGWTGYTIKEISPGIYKIYGGTLTGSAIAIYVKQVIRSNIITINLQKLSFFNPYIDIDADYSNAPYGAGPYYDYSIGKEVYDMLPPEEGRSFEIKAGVYPIPNIKDPANDKYTLKDNYYIYKTEVHFSPSLVQHKIGPDSSNVWNDPSTNTFTKPVYFVKNSNGISVTVSSVIWKRAKQDSTPTWQETSPDALNACCAKEPDYTFQFTSENAPTCSISVSPDEVTVKNEQDLKVHVGNVSTVVHIYMINPKTGEKIENAFSASYKGGRERKILTDLWYNPGHISGTNIETLPVSFDYDDNLDVTWKNGDVLFKSVAFQRITTCTECPASVVVEVFIQKGDTYPLCEIINDAVTVKPIVKKLTADYEVLPQGGTAQKELLAGLREPIYVTVSFTNPNIQWRITYNNKPIGNYGITFNVTKIDTKFKIEFDKPLPFDEQYSPNILKIEGEAFNDDYTEAEQAIINVSAKEMTEDKIPPEIKITQPAQDSITNQKVIKIEGRVTDNIGVAKVLINNSEIDIDQYGNFEESVTLKEGENDIPIEAMDVSGNKKSIELKITLDTVPPELTVYAEKETIEKTVEISGETEKNATVTINGQIEKVNEDGKFSSTIPLEIGKNTIIVSATDAAGNKTTKEIVVIRKEKIVIVLTIDNPYMYVNNNLQEIDPGRGTKPVIIPKWGRTVVPIRAIVEALHGTIGWDPVERKVTIVLNGNKVELWIDNPMAKVNGTAKWIDANNHDVKPIIINDRTMLPIRFIAESLGAKVDWDASTKTITITYTP